MKNRYTTGHKGFITLLENDWDEILLDDLKIEHEKEIKPIKNMSD